MMGKSITRKIASVAASALAAFALVALFALPPQAQAQASELSAAGLVSQSAYTNTSLANAMELPFGEAYTGTFDYGSDGNFELYWFSFKTSNRESEYEVRLDSVNGKRITTNILNGEGGNDLWEWSAQGFINNYHDFLNTRNRLTISSSSIAKNSWRYIVVRYDAASRYDQYRITVFEHRILKPENVTISPASFTYDGSAKRPTVTVSYEGVKLVKDVDYTVEYFNNTNAGEGTVKVTGIGDNFTGEVSKTFPIKQRQADLKVNLSRSTFAYNGYEQRPGVTVLDGSTELVEGQDYDLVTPEESTDPNRYTVTVKCKNNYAGVGQAFYTIDKAPSSITIPSQTKVYTGAVLAHTRDANVSGSQGRVTRSYFADANCTKPLAASLVKNAGVYYVKATVAADDYHKAATSKPVSFTIAKAPIAVPKATTRLAYNGKKRTGVPAGLYYSVKGNKAVGVGSYKATLTADGNHVFSNGKTKVAVKWSIAKASQKISAKSVSRSFSAKKSGKAKVLGANKVVDLKSAAKVSAKTTVQFAKANQVGGSKISVNAQTGKVTLKKGLKAGTYRVRVKVTANASASYKAAKAKTITLTVTVK